MCRSAAQGGRRCSGGHTATGASTTTPQPPPPAATGMSPKTRREFLAATVRDLARIDPDTGEVHVTPQPKGCSEKAYRDHLESGARMTVIVRGSTTSRWRDLDPESARVLSNQSRRKGLQVEVTWSEGTR